MNHAHQITNQTGQLIDAASEMQATVRESLADLVGQVGHLQVVTQTVGQRIDALLADRTRAAEYVRDCEANVAAATAKLASARLALAAIDDGYGEIVLSIFADAGVAAPKRKRKAKAVRRGPGSNLGYTNAIREAILANTVPGQTYTRDDVMRIARNAKSGSKNPESLGSQQVTNAWGREYFKKTKAGMYERK